jgi:hypothetical protein
VDCLDAFTSLKGMMAGDAEFHRSRIMFCLKGGKVEVARPGLTESHIKWFESEGWVKEGNTGEFLENNIKGFYLPVSNEMYCYKGAGWFFDAKVLAKVVENIENLKAALGLNEKTKFYLGPKDSVIGGVAFRRKYIGTLKELTDGGKI